MFDMKIFNKINKWKLKKQFKWAFTMMEMIVVFTIIAIAMWIVLWNLWFFSFGSKNVQNKMQEAYWNLNTELKKVNEWSTFSDIFNGWDDSATFDVNNYPILKTITSDCWIKVWKLKTYKLNYQKNIMIWLYWLNWTPPISKAISNFVDAINKINQLWTVVFLYWEKGTPDDYLNDDSPYKDQISNEHFITIVITPDNNWAVLKYKDSKWKIRYVNISILNSDWSDVSIWDSNVMKLRSLFGKIPSWTTNTEKVLKRILYVNDALKTKLDSILWDLNTNACKYKKLIK